jgi:hypothetical protein
VCARVDRATVSRAREKCRPPPHDGQALSDGEQPARPRAASFAQRSCFHLASTAKAHGSNFQDDLEEIDQVQRLTGAPEEIRTPDPQIRSLDPFVDPTSFSCKPGSNSALTLQGVRSPSANRFDPIEAAPATPIAAELQVIGGGPVFRKADRYL